MPSTESDINLTDVPLDREEQSEEERYESDVKTVAHYIGLNQCILFLGSAIHAPAPPGSPYVYPREKCPPFGDQLSKALAKASRYPKKEDPKNLQRVSWYYEKQATFRSKLIKTVKELIHTGREPSPVLRGLARLGFPIVITTNYDQLYEQALTQVAQEKARQEGKSEADVAETSAKLDKWVYTPKRTVQTVDCSPEPSSERPYLLKIHGDIDKANSIVITDEDYIDFILRMNDPTGFRPVGENVRTHLMKWPTLFIGYRLVDYNLRLLFRTLRWDLDDADIPENYSVDIRPDILVRDWWENRRRYVRFITKDLWTFVPDLYREVKKEEMPQ